TLPSVRLACLRFPVPPSRSLFLAPATPATYTLSLHDALPISHNQPWVRRRLQAHRGVRVSNTHKRRCESEVTHSAVAADSCIIRSEEHTSELQSRFDLVCRLLLEKKKKTSNHTEERWRQRIIE